MNARRLRAPLDDGAALIDPPLSQAAQLVEQNAALAQRRQYQCHGVGLHKLAFAARHELFDTARRYTAEYADVSDLPSFNSQSRMILAGHQPELFHSGVWLKNFVLSAIGQQFGAIAVNLLIDNDTVRSATIRVPGGTPENPVVEQIAIDAPGEEVPWEERAILDRQQFGEFGRRVAQSMGALASYTPIVQELWPLAEEAAGRQGDATNLGRTLAEARHRYERRLGLRTLEVPLSLICQRRSFRWFAAHLLAELPRLHAIYNSALAEYRRANRVRSRSHPVPDLAMQDDWHEAPFWVWTRSDPRRRRLFVRSTKGMMQLSDFGSVQSVLPLSGSDLEAAVEQLAAMETNGICVRPRALVTTMYARFVLSDLFIHGIGGAKYDELTDEIIRPFFGCEPPAYITATATVRLPIERPATTEDELNELSKSLRELRFHPERFITNSPVAEKKRDLLSAQNLRGGPRDEFLRLDALNRQMYDLLAPQREELERRRTTETEALRRATLLGSREFSFCLFPQESLPRLLLDLCAPRS